MFPALVSPAHAVAMVKVEIVEEKEHDPRSPYSSASSSLSAGGWCSDIDGTGSLASR